ncbi:hypothetical protein [Paenarthrobacter aromaticivorans]|uniref:Uncharacterized protein n=1 Tax=Paenarthrobacter aromaticivorans TaxID=2849150 RepID=A0ABS6I1F8_9MICC|nr:hypothetical protein [Paenarthrobacter sp. MMS21-TAE1-1]MBU8865576.1 hypothetical protein [Paenarthrobacter sp. MMS21-TAE1-1]
MIQVVAAVLMWLLVISLLPGTRRRDHSVLTAAITIAVAMTLNIDPVYTSLDEAFAARNYVDLLANVSMVVGIYFLSKAIIRAATPEDAGEGRDAIGAVVLGVVILGLVSSFSFITTHGSSTRFMLDYGDQFPAALYSAIQFVYIGYVVSITGATCFRFRPGMSRPYYRLAFTFIGIGCALAVLLVSLVLVMDTLHLQGRLDAMRAVSPAYDVTVVAALAFLCVGLAIPPVARRILRLKDAATEDDLVRGLRVVWDKTAGMRQDVRLQLGVEDLAQQAPALKLHRMLVEVQDALLVEPGLASSLDIRELRVLSAAENYLAGPIERGTKARKQRGERAL